MTKHFIPEALLKESYYLNHLPLYFKTALGMTERVSYFVALLNDYNDALDNFYEGYSSIAEKVNSLKASFIDFFYENEELCNYFIDMIAAYLNVPSVLTLQYTQQSEVEVPDDISSSEELAIRNVASQTFVFQLTQWQKLLLINRAILSNGYDGSRKMLNSYRSALQDVFKLDVEYSYYDDNVVTWCQSLSDGMIPQTPNTGAHPDRTMTDDFIDNAKAITVNADLDATNLYDTTAFSGLSNEARYFISMLTLIQNDYLVIKSLGLTYGFSSASFAFAGVFADATSFDALHSFYQQINSCWLNNSFEFNQNGLINVYTTSAGSQFEYAYTYANDIHTLNDAAAFIRDAEDGNFADGRLMSKYRLGAVFQ